MLHRLIFLANLLLFATSAHAQEVVAPDQSDAAPSIEQQVALTPAANKPDLAEGVAANYLSSRYARSNGDIGASITYLSKLHKQYPDNGEIASQLMIMQVVKGDLPLALTLAREVEKSDAIDPLAELLLVVDMIKQADFDAASKRVNASFGQANGQLWVPLLDAWVDVGKGQMKNPVMIEELPVTVGKAAALMNYHLALINNAAGFTEQATQNFHEAVNEDDTPLRWLQMMQHFYDEHGKPALLKPAVDAFHTNNPKLASQRLESLVITPADGISEVLYTMGIVMQMASVHHDAAVYLQLARYLRPDFHLASLTLAEVLKEAGYYALSNAAIASIPAHSQLYTEAQLRQVLNLNAMSKNDEALKNLSALIVAQPDSIQPWVVKGDILRADKNFKDAIAAYSEAIVRIDAPSKNDWAVYYARATCLERLSRWDEAKEDFTKALAVAPNQPDVLNYYAYSMIVRGENIEQARDMLLRAVERRPNDAHIVDSLGWAYFLLKDYQNALVFMERAVDLMPSDVTVNDHLGDIYYRLGRKKEAQFQWQRSLTYKPDANEVLMIQQKISNGLGESDKPARVAIEKPASVDVN